MFYLKGFLLSWKAVELGGQNFRTKSSCYQAITFTLCLFLGLITPWMKDIGVFKICVQGVPPSESYQKSRNFPATEYIVVIVPFLSLLITILLKKKIK